MQVYQEPICLVTILCMTTATPHCKWNEVMDEIQIDQLISYVFNNTKNTLHLILSLFSAQLGEVFCQQPASIFSRDAFKGINHLIAGRMQKILINIISFIFSQ